MSINYQIIIKRKELSTNVVAQLVTIRIATKLDSDSITGEGFRFYTVKQKKKKNPHVHLNGM